MDTYYITGISGFLGRNIVKELNSRGKVNIVGLVFPNERNLDNLKEQENITLVEGNIMNTDDIFEIPSFSYCSFTTRRRTRKTRKTKSTTKIASKA